MDSNRLLSAEGNGLGKTTNESGGAFTRIPDNSGNATNHLEVRTMLICVAGGAELEPPVRVPHTVYVKSLYRTPARTTATTTSSGPARLIG